MVLTERNAASGDENETNHDNYVWAVQITSFSRRYPFLLRKVKAVQFPLQSVSKRRVCSIVSLFAISTESQEENNEPSGTRGGGGS